DRAEGAEAALGRAGRAVARRSAVPQPADRRLGQHAPLGVLHRQAVRARVGNRTPRLARAARVRDAAACAHVANAATAAALARRALLGEAVSPRAPRAL